MTDATRSLIEPPIPTLPLALVHAAALTVCRRAHDIDDARLLLDALGGGGYSTDPLNGRRERLWLSPACNVHDQQVLIPEHGESLS